MWRNDDERLSTEADIATAAEDFDGVLLSPGPGTPERAGASIPLVRACAAAKTPLLGVCLGHQAIGVAFGGTVDRAPELLHGKTSTVFHANVGVLQGLPDPFTATRYHSLTILPDTVPAELEVTARTAGRGHHGRAARRAAHPRRAVPPRVDPHRGRAPDVGQLAGLLRRRPGRVVGANARERGGQHGARGYAAKLSVSVASKFTVLPGDGL